MTRQQQGRDLVRTLVKARLYAECPCCGEDFLLADGQPFYLDDFTPAAREVYKRALSQLSERRRGLAELRKAIPESSERGTRAVNVGLILERIAPVMDQFAFDHYDCRALFDPIDYVVFEGLRVDNQVHRIVFIDIKTGSARLSARQQAIKGAVDDGRVEWDTYTMGATR